MIHFSSIRASGPPQPLSARIFRTLLALLLGAGLGALAKVLDGLPSNALPFLLERLDLRDVFRFEACGFRQLGEGGLPAQFLSELLSLSVKCLRLLSYAAANFDSSVIS